MLNRGVARLLCAAAMVAATVITGFVEGTDVDTSATGYWVPKNPPRAYYNIDCTIDPTKGLLQGTEVIHFRNTVSRPIYRLAIKWFSLGEQHLEIKSGGKPVSSLANNGSYPTVFELPEAVGPGKEINLEIKFSVSMPTGGGNKDKFSLTNWYPRLWWGFETHDDYDVKLQVTNGYTIATSGLFNKKTGCYRAKAVRSFGLFISKGFKTIETNAADVLIRCVFPPKGEKCARLLLSTAADVIKFYRERFGFYPYSSLTIIPGMDRPAGGYPVATSVVAIHGMEQMDSKPKLHWQWITAHEIGHQYWWEYVIEKDNPGWLRIGLGIYADREYVLAKGLGPKKHQELMARYIEGVREGFDTTVNRSEEELSKIDFDFNNVVTHGKGYSIISALDCILGEEVFYKIYRQCLKKFGGRRMGLHEFQAVCEEETGQELGWFFDQWINSNRYLSYQISSRNCIKKGSRYFSEVEVQCLGNLKMPVPVTAYFEDRTFQKKFTERFLDVSVLQFESESPLKEVKIDPDGKLALIVPPPQSLIEKEELIKKMRAVPYTGAGKKALNIFEEVRDSSVSDVKAWFVLGLALYDGKYYSEALEAFGRLQVAATRNTIVDFVALVWQGHILDIFGRRKEALDKYKEALKKAKRFEMRHDQYGIKINRQWVEERLKKRFERK